MSECNHCSGYVECTGHPLGRPIPPTDSSTIFKSVFRVDPNIDDNPDLPVAGARAGIPSAKCAPRTTSGIFVAFMLDGWQ